MMLKLYMHMKIKLLGKNLEELKKLVADAGLPGFTAKQIAQWLYVKKVRSIDDMTNLSKAARASLSEKYEVGLTEYGGLQLSSDGTKKYLFLVKCAHRRGLNLSCNGKYPENELEEGAVEAVMIPDDDRATLCVSSQSGCRMGCKFCMTGRQGFHGHLSAADIISQFIAVKRERKKSRSFSYIYQGDIHRLKPLRAHVLRCIFKPFGKHRSASFPSFSGGQSERIRSL